MASHYIQACTNGRQHDAREASIAPLNRGFLYGDAIYEVWRTYDGVVFAWEEHWRRLEQSAAALEGADDQLHRALDFLPLREQGGRNLSVLAQHQRDGLAQQHFVQVH